MGAFCEVESGSDAHVCDSTDKSKTGVCKIPDGTQTFVNALTEGFAVPEFPSASWTSLTGLDWRAPTSARTVACAAFICPPVIRERDGYATIVNYDRCVAADYEASGTEGTFDPRDPKLTHVPSNADLLQLAPGCVVVDSEETIPNIMGIWVGCWAYDDANLIAATRLTELRINSDITTSGWVTSEIGVCADDEEGYNCSLPAGLVGTCMTNVCRERCLSDQLCPKPLKCDFGSGELVGLCKEAP